MALAVATGTTLAASTIYSWLLVSYIDEAREIVVRGDQLWPSEMERVLARAESLALDKSSLAKRLAGDRDGSLAAEGMLMLVRHHTYGARQILEAHLRDRRVNQFLMTDGDLARECLRVVTIEEKLDSTPEERARAEHQLSSELSSTTMP